MPHDQDLDEDPTRPSTYECLRCGDIVKVETHPGECSECSGEYQNRAKSLE